MCDSSLAEIIFVSVIVISYIAFVIGINLWAINKDNKHYGR